MVRSSYKSKYRRMADKITTIITPYLLRPPRLEIYQGNTLPMHDRPAKDLRPLQFIPNHTFHTKSYIPSQPIPCFPSFWPGSILSTSQYWGCGEYRTAPTLSMVPHSDSFGNILHFRFENSHYFLRWFFHCLLVDFAQPP
jgi:hypothetical protein